MVVEHSKRLLERLVEMSRLGLDKTPRMIVQELLFEQAKDHFPNMSPEELHFELLSNGLFEPDEIKDLDSTLRKMEEMNVWGIVDEEYEQLKILWNGKDCPIYIFPLTNYRPVIDGIVANKNGVSYKEVVFLFVSEELAEMEIKAMVAHEYHHFCRMHVLEKAPDAMTLKESLILEGMAECMVEELYGVKWCSPWISKYSIAQLKRIWQKVFVPALDKEGIHHHFQFLYGDGTKSLPNWIGYCMGYAIVKSYLEKNGQMNPQTLLTLSADEIILKSDFA